MRPSRSIGVAVLLFAISVAVHAVALDYSPIYLTHDEVVFGLQAKSIADTARDRSGQFLPLYFPILADYWAQPLVIYATALSLKVFPLSETAVRLPSAVIGAVNVVLVYFIAIRVFRRQSLATIAAVLTLLTPAHFIHSRLAMDYIYPLPFLLCWLLFVLRFVEHRQERDLAVACLALGLGFYSYIASIVTMPLFVALTLLIVARVDGLHRRSVAIAATAFALPLLLVVAWGLQNPEAYASQVRRYKLYDPEALNAAQGVREFLNPVSLTARLSVYWNFFDPSLWYFSGGSNYVNATRAAGVFLIPIAVLFPIGLIYLLRQTSSIIALVLLGALILSPVAATIVVEPYAIDRALGLVPFGILIAVFGFSRLWDSQRPSWRAVAVLALCAVPLQFAQFTHDYYTDYRIRSLYYFERNVRGAVNAALNLSMEDRSAAVYLSEQTAWIRSYWDFYTIAREAGAPTEPLVSVVRFDRIDPDVLEPGAILVAEAEDPAVSRWVEAGVVDKGAVISEPNGSPSFWVGRRQ